MKASKLLFTLVSVAAILALAGCGGQSSSDDASPASDQAASEPGPEVLAALAKADLVDGAKDMTVSKCYTCAFHMEGKADQSVDVGEYHVHLCSAACKEKFEGDPTGVILATAVPEDHSGHDH